MSDDNRKNPGIKIPFLDITDKPIVDGTRCVEVRIPDDDKYMPVLAGLIAIATKWFNWQRDDLKRGTQIAKIWQLAYIETDWGSCMNCEELIACLQPVLDAQTEQIINQVTNNVMNFQQFGTQTPGVPMTPEVLETNLAEGTNPTCDYDILWAQSLAIIQYTNRAIEDLFQAIESASNVVELVDIFTDLPIVTWISDTLGAEFAEGLINYYQEAVAEGYLAQYTELVEQELACAVFCAARVDCAITVDLLYGIFYSRVQLLVPDDPVDTIELLLLLAGIAPVGSTVVDLMFWFAWASAKLMSFFVSDSLSNIINLQQLLNLAVNDANNDWQILCDCPALIAQNVGLFTECGNGVISFTEFEDGVPFDLEAYEVTVIEITSFVIALRLPPGDWNVELNSITGTITPPVDTTETAYAWNDAMGFHNVLWNAPAGPDDFGDHDTTLGVQPLWCTDQDWNAALFNSTAFSANFTVTAI